MSEQYIVAAFLDGSLIVDAAGPYRSQEKAERVCEQINVAGVWTDDQAMATIIAQVVELRPASELIAQATPMEES